MLFLKISKYSQENTCGGVFFNKVAGLKAAFYATFTDNRSFKSEERYN